MGAFWHRKYFPYFYWGNCRRTSGRGRIGQGIPCVETFDYDVVDKIYEPFDNLGLSIYLHGDGTREYKVIGSLAEAVKAISSDSVQWKRLKEIFASPSLQMVTFSRNRKGYVITEGRRNMVSHLPL